MNRNIIKNIGRFLIFAVFIVLPFVCFFKLMYTMYSLTEGDDVLLDILARLVSTVGLPWAILTVVSLHEIGFYFLKKEDGWRKFTFKWLLLQAIISAIFGIYIVISDIIMSKQHFSTAAMSFLYILSFVIVAVFDFREKKNS